MKKSLKILSIVMAVVLIFACGVGGTLAYLAAKTGPVENVFTYGNLSVKLTETPAEYKIIPGTTITKDPKASVVEVEGAAKVNAYLFVEIKEENWPVTEPTRKVDYAIDPSWTKLEGVDGVNNVYYREVTPDQYGTAYSILDGDKVTVAGTLTKAEVDAAQASAPKLTFTAYAVQKDNLGTPAKAWAEVGTAVAVNAATGK